jgi:hypothetical protein
MRVAEGGRAPEIGRALLRRGGTRRNAMKNFAIVAFALALQIGFIAQLAWL